MIHDVRRDHEGINGLPRGMKSYPKQFSRFPYYVAETLWRILDGRSEKEKMVKICNDIQEANHAMKDVIQFHRNGDQININSLP